ncbi:MAG TPA: DUF2071 domain-containing protein [Acidimicrobiales bacterium]|nr:DUF2071 domain-containing protein [Acidimicrobiales bacterium]
MPGYQPEESVRLPLVRQRWDSIAFINWRYPRPLLSALVPAHLEVEEIDGSAWVTMTPFVARATRLAGLGRVPDFPETNLRTYVRTRSGRGAVWFLSIEAASPVMVAGARALLGVPYRWAVMSARTGGERCEYHSRRRADGRHHHVEIWPGPRLDPARVAVRDHLLTGRWLAVPPRAGARLAVPVHHQPWDLHAAEVGRLEEDLTAAAGLPAPEESPNALWSPGVDAVLGAPRRG